MMENIMYAWYRRHFHQNDVVNYLLPSKMKSRIKWIRNTFCHKILCDRKPHDLHVMSLATMEFSVFFFRRRTWQRMSRREKNNKMLDRYSFMLTHNHVHDVLVFVVVVSMIERNSSDSTFNILQVRLDNNFKAGILKILLSLRRHTFRTHKIPQNSLFLFHSLQVSLEGEISDGITWNVFNVFNKLSHECVDWFCITNAEKKKSIHCRHLFLTTQYFARVASTNSLPTKSTTRYSLVFFFHWKRFSIWNICGFLHT